ncbi:hypothetical protein MLC35_07335 [Sulfurimonas sp. NW7]|uniref:hypothetical protein n=1 Tax=Sulfurimonas sp. NW7 TaxID=2922727 RepID=UPI003DAA1F08
MAYIYGLIIVTLLFAALHYFTELDNSQKLLIGAILLFIILGAITYNKYNQAQRDKMLKTIIKYKQGKTITCNGVDVNADIYSLSTGTYTFIGKKNTPHYAEMISADSCE